MALKIREATAADAATIHRFILALAEYERAGPGDVAVTLADLEVQLASERPPFECLLAEEGDEALGFALYFWNYSTWRGQPGLYLEDLFVPPEHRDRGVGFALLGELAAIAVARGAARMEWVVLDWNQPAIDFYRRLGARPLDGWTVFRLTGEALARLGGG